jgi:hypothetical protein
MTRTRFLLLSALLLMGLAAPVRSDGEKKDVREESFAAPNGVTVKVRLQAPYEMDTPLQVVCYFKHKMSGDTTTGSAAEMDRRLSGAVASLRNRGEFVGEELETLLLTTVDGTIKPKRLLLVGLGDEKNLSLGTLERAGNVALREAAKLGVERVAFAPNLEVQGNTQLDVCDVERAVTRGMLLAYDTEKRLQKEGLAKAFTLEEWVAEAGEKYFDDTLPGAQQGIEDAEAAIAKRPSEPYGGGK